MAWLGSSGGCAVYYFITSWLVGLSNYLVVCLVCMILVRELLGLSKKTSRPLPGEEGSLSVGPPSRVQVPPALPRRHHRPPRNPGALHQVQVLVSFYFEPASNFPPGPLWSPLVRASAFSPRGLIVEREKKTFVLKEFSPGTPCTPCTSSSNCSYATSSPLSLSSSASSDQGAVLSQMISQTPNFSGLLPPRESL